MSKQEKSVDGNPVIANVPDNMDIENLGEYSGSLIVVTVGTEKIPATRSDVERVANTIYETTKGIDDVITLIVPHMVKVERISLPELKNILRNDEKDLTFSE